MIPDFNLFGVVPPVRPGAAGHSSDRSPYITETRALCERFGSSEARRAILLGLLDLRAALRAAGVADGYQWINGSFTEDVEQTRGRAPQDIDVVTFAVLGGDAGQEALYAAHPALFDHAHIKETYEVDHYLVATDVPFDIKEAHRVAYWYSMWSHQRGTDLWKGFVSVPLTSDDEAARGWLEAQNSAGANP